MEITDNIIKLAGFFEFQKTDILDALLRLPHRTIALFSGNQAGKTSSVAQQYFMRSVGIHPVKAKNLLAKKIRCMSSSLPSNSNAEEQDNTQYLELKKRIPYELIEKDVTARSANLVIRRPPGMNSPKTVFEFRSSKQELQDLGKIQLSSVWHDEETPKPHREECKMRLVAENGDEIFSLTPINALCFDDKTELITKRGWKRYDEILMSDVILTHNMGKNVLEWKSMNGFTMNHYKGKMIHMKNGSFDFLVTPNHKWLVCNDRRKNELYLEETKNLNSKHIIKRISPRETESWRLEDNPNYEDNFIRLAGWLVSDGTVNRDYVIYQSLTAYPEHCQTLDDIAKCYLEIRTETREYGNTIIEGKEWIGSGLMRRYRIIGYLKKRLRKILNGKSVSEDFICSLSCRQLQILFDAITDGDGYRTESGGVRLNQRNNEDLIDSFQLISTLLGRLSRKKKWINTNYKPIDGINVYSNSERFWPNTHVKSLNISEIDYDGIVWCPSTENKTVVVRRNGSVSISGNSYTFDDIWQHKAFIYRTKTVADILNKPRVEKFKSGYDIACIQMATDDNPSLTPDAIERVFMDITDPDELMLRRYGVFKQISGRVHKTYDPSICYIDYNKYFPSDIPYGWLHSRGIDYHESRTPWSVGWMSVSPEDEWFLWREFHPAIDGSNAYNTYEIAKYIVRNSGDYYYEVNLIDPLANKKQANTLFSTVDDLNRYFEQFRNNEGLGTPAYWKPWDTKGVGGRNEVSMRFKNAVRCGKPFNNRIRKHGRDIYLPTLWICNTCPKTNISIINWRFGEHVATATKMVNDPKPDPQQKHSHDCMVVECLAKDNRIKHSHYYTTHRPDIKTHRSRSVTGR